MSAVLTGAALQSKSHADHLKAFLKEICTVWLKTIIPYFPSFSVHRGKKNVTPYFFHES